MSKIQTISITVPASRPRNPLVALAHARKAGSHQPTTKTQRQQARGALRRELACAHGAADVHSP